MRLTGKDKGFDEGQDPCEEAATYGYNCATHNHMTLHPTYNWIVVCIYIATAPFRLHGRNSPQNKYSYTAAREWRFAYQHNYGVAVYHPFRLRRSKGTHTNTCFSSRMEQT